MPASRAAATFHGMSSTNTIADGGRRKRFRGYRVRPRVALQHPRHRAVYQRVQACDERVVRHARVPVERREVVGQRADPYPGRLRVRHQRRRLRPQDVRDHPVQQVHELGDRPARSPQRRADLVGPRPPVAALGDLPAQHRLPQRVGLGPERPAARRDRPHGGLALTQQRQPFETRAERRAAEIQQQPPPRHSGILAQWSGSVPTNAPTTTVHISSQAAHQHTTCRSAATQYSCTNAGAAPQAGQNRTRWLVSNGPVRESVIFCACDYVAPESGRDAVQLTVRLFTAALRRW